MKRPFVLLLFPGPTYRLEEIFLDRLNALSADFDGALITSAPSRVNLTVGTFQAVAVATRRTKLASFLAYIRQIRDVIEDRRSRGGVQLVVSYDPLKTGLLGIYAAKKSGARLLAEVNGDYTNTFNYMEVTNPYLRQLKQRAYVTIEKFVLRRASAIKLLYPEQISSLNISPAEKHIRTYPAFVGTSQFEWKSHDNVILTAGFPLYVKGIDILISAFKAVANSYPTWRLNILGHYPDRTLIDALIDGHPQIEVHRPVHHSEMPDQIGTCGIFVLASRTECMGRVLVEAMAAAKPRIGTNVGGIPTVIRHNEDGLLVAPANIDELANAIRRLIDDRELRERLGLTAQDRARKEFSEEAYFRNTRNFYHDILNA